METNFSSGADFSSASGVAILSIEMILALIANGIVLLITITQRKSWKQSATILFTSLILAHLLLALNTPFFIIALASGEWIFGSTVEEKRGTCLFANFIFWYIVLVWWTKVGLFRLFSVSVSSYVFLFSCVPVSLFIVTCMDVCIWVIVNICMASRGQEQEYSGQFQESLDHVFFCI